MGTSVALAAPLDLHASTYTYDDRIDDDHGSLVPGEAASWASRADDVIEYDDDATPSGESSVPWRAKDRAYCDADHPEQRGLLSAIATAVLHDLSRPDEADRSPPKWACWFLRASEALDDDGESYPGDERALLDSEDVWNVYLEADGSLTRVCRVRLVDDAALITVDMAGCLQEAVIDETHDARPKCPLHEHPLWPEAGDAAVWRCPSGLWSCPIGGYVAATERHGPSTE